MTMRPLCISALLLVFGPMVVSHTEPRVGGLDVLRNLVSLNADEVAAIDRGEPVVKTLDAQEKREAVRLADELQSLLGSWPDRDQSIQAFRQYVAEYPRKPLPDVEDFLYWSKEHVGRKPVVSITHVAIHHRPDRIFIASKQIYASHYFDGSLGLTVAADPDNPTRRGMYLAYVNRSRIDALGGMFGGFLRAILRSRLREGVRKNLQQTVAQVESACDGNRTVPALAPLQ